MKNLILRSLAVLALLVVVACGGGISQDSYDKVKTGMTLTEVEDILGKHSSGSSNSLEAGGIKLGAAVYKWEDSDKVVTITFGNDKVTIKTKSVF